MTRGWEGLIAGNPLNALPVPAKQDVMTRGWYVQGANTRHSGVDAPHKPSIQYAMDWQGNNECQRILDHPLRE
jgi:hypothetical protein